MPIPFCPRVPSPLPRSRRSRPSSSYYLPAVQRPLSSRCVGLGTSGSQWASVLRHKLVRELSEQKEEQFFRVSRFTIVCNSNKRAPMLTSIITGSNWLSSLALAQSASLLVPSPSVGASDGDDVGDAVGASDGDAVGEAVGDAVGDGARDGAGDGAGASVSPSVGAPVGALVGALVGTTVGATVSNPPLLSISLSGSMKLFVFVPSLSFQAIQLSSFAICDSLVHALDFHLSLKPIVFPSGLRLAVLSEKYLCMRPKSFTSL